MEAKGKLVLVGAGPGDPELITVKGIKALEHADVILYDALVHPDLLLHARKGAVIKFVGKRSGKPSFSQDEINQLIINYALQGLIVVRLKGGDSFIFGRGFEELEFAKHSGVLTEVVPGLSSSTAVPALQRVPLTTRGINESFWVITGTTSARRLSGDIALAAQSTATVVVLMGFKKLAAIRDIYLELGKENMPVAIIQSGSTSEEKHVVGTMKDILERAQEKELGTPAIIVIGPTVALHDDYVAAYTENELIKSAIQAA